MSKETLNPRIHADILDSLHYLSEINSQLSLVKEGKLSEQDFLSFVNRRSEEYGYISSTKYTLRVIEEVKNTNQPEKGLLLSEEGKVFQYDNPVEVAEHVKEMEANGWITFKLARDMYKFVKTTEIQKERL